MLSARLGGRADGPEGTAHAQEGWFSGINKGWQVIGVASGLVRLCLMHSWVSFLISVGVSLFGLA